MKKRNYYDFNEMGEIHTKEKRIKDLKELILKSREEIKTIQMEIIKIKELSNENPNMDIRDKKRLYKINQKKK